jgi:hypothetical protein
MEYVLVMITHKSIFLVSCVWTMLCRWVSGGFDFFFYCIACGEGREALIFLGVRWKYAIIIFTVWKYAIGISLTGGCHHSY